MTPSLPATLRAGVLAALLGALLAPEPRSATTEAGRIVRFPADRTDGEVVDSLLVGAAPALVVRSSEDPPHPTEMEVLAAVADRAPLLVRLPDEVRLLEVDAPERPIAGRAAAISFGVRLPVPDSVLVRLSDGTGALDSLRVAAGPDGVAEGAFRVRPPRPGWREWTVEAAGTRTRTGAWVAPGDPPRVLVAAGPPRWESKFVVRALEESGARVDLVQSLGRGLAVGQGLGSLPAAAEALAPFDAVLVLEGADPGAAQRGALAEFASRHGGGVLWAGGGEEAEVAGEAIRWTLPAELAALPRDRVRSSAGVPGDLVPGVVLAAASPRGTVLALGTAGRGRVASLALTETWRWRMEAGRVAEHREFWRSLVDWLASAPRDSLVVEVPQPVGPVGTPVDVRVYAPVGSRADHVTVLRPDGLRDSLPVAVDPDRPGVLRARFVPDRLGVYRIALAGARPAAFRADDELTGAPSPWARLALLAHRSGGGAFPADAFEAELARRRSDEPDGGGGLPWRWMLVGLAAGLAVAEWTVRRLSGRA